MYITVLCKVVDNFGDIGVAWRLCRRLAKIQSEYKINLIVDDLEAFSKIESAVIASEMPVIVSEMPVIVSEMPVIASEMPVIASAAKQSISIDDIEIFPWNDDELCHEVFSRNDGERLSLILELFQCGRPDWMERILFEEKLQCTVQIIMIDYLTAEKYAEDFHCLQSLTRSSKVRKVNFMPGFTKRTGGLVIDDEWQDLPIWKKDGPVLVFTYERDWTSLVEALLSAVCLPVIECPEQNTVVECPKGVSKPPFEPRILVAQGRGKESFMTAVRKVVECSRSECIENNFVEELPYLNQTEWDQMMKNCSALVIRGEESMSRACLSGIPFIWQAYPQSDEYQLVKVKALLERMRPHFDEADFEIVEKAWLEINNNVSFPDSKKVSFPDLIGESRHNCDVQIVGSSPTMTQNVYSQFFEAVPCLVPGFQDFALSLRKNGDLAYNLMTYIKKLAIM